jgi:hypothetical protein
MILPDDEFLLEFPDAYDVRHYEHEPRWLLLNVAIAEWLSRQTGLLIDFQIQPMTVANDRHKGPRQAIGILLTKQNTTDAEPSPGPVEGAR